MKSADIASRVARHIIESCQPGQRLPTVRELAQKEGISLVTALNVYRKLALEGLVVAKKGAGTFVAHATDDGIIDMSRVRPGPEQLMWVLGHLHGSMDGLVSYDRPEGYEPLRECAARWLAASGIEGSPIITSGAQQALFLVGLALMGKGGTVVVEDPGYQGASRIFSALGARVVSVPYLKDLNHLDRLASLSFRILYTMPQGHIPTGAFMPADVRQALVGMARDKGFFIIEDDPFSEILGMSPLKSMDRSGRVIYLKSMSNILGPGLRMGIAVAPEDVHQDIVRLKEMNDLSLSGILQRCLHDILGSPSFARHMVALRQEIAERKKTMEEILGIHTHGVCAWIACKGSGRMHLERLLERGVRITPGDIYGPAWSEHIRLSLMGTSRPDCERGLAIVAGYLANAGLSRLSEY